jgi:hypothetical protein
MKKSVLLLSGLAALALFTGCPAPGTPDPTTSPSATPTAEEIATFNNMKASACSEESSLKSLESTQSTNVAFKNTSGSSINIYWLDQNGARKEYKKGLASGATHNQQTFVTHPWVITNSADQCMGIYTPTSTSAVTLDVKQTITVGSGNTSTTGSTTVSGDVSEQRVRNGINCLKTKNSSVATAVEVQLNLYTQAKGRGGVFDIAAQAYLTSAAQLLTREGC